MATVYLNRTYKNDDDLENKAENSTHHENMEVHLEVPDSENVLSNDVAPKNGSTLTLHDINYSVDVKTRRLFGRTAKKEILKDVSGVFRPGLNVVIGPTGCGKSTLLDIIAGRKNPKGLTGTLLLGGRSLPHNFKCMVGYVTQEDFVMGTLTVKENIQFSASLRLPQSWPKSQRDQKVEEVIAELNLEHCANMKVGTEFSHGISGGERKRCHIGMELIISPPVLILDEPTSGLDAFTAITVVDVLKSLRGRTIVFSIHQPRFNIFRLFDHLTVMSMGEFVYHGPSLECQQFFQAAGYFCQEFNNPPDFFLDVLSGESGTDSSRTKQDINTARLDVHKKLVASYKQSQWNTSITSTLSEALQEHNKEGGARTLPAVKYATGPVVQFMYCGQRNLRNIFRNPATVAMLFFVRVILGLMVGALYWKIDDSCRFGLQNRIGAFFLLTMQMVFSNLSTVQLFLNNRIMFIHENSGGFYRTSSFFLSSVLCDVFLMRFLPVAINTPVVYFMLGLTADFRDFIAFFCSLLFASIAATAVGFFISAIVRVSSVANLLVTFVFIVFMIFSGLLVNLESISSFLQWIKYISILRYCMTALSINGLKDMEFKKYDSNTTCISGNEYLQNQGIEFETNWDIWKNYIALILITTGFLVLTYLRLRFMNKLK